VQAQKNGFSSWAPRLLAQLLLAPAASTQETRRPPLTLARAREIHRENLTELAQTPCGRRNQKLNEVAFFAGQAFAVQALEGTEASVKKELLEVAAQCGLPENEAKSTLRSGWKSGLEKPSQYWTWSNRPSFGAPTCRNRYFADSSANGAGHAWAASPSPTLGLPSSAQQACW
jgi:hypothetical protein